MVTYSAFSFAPEARLRAYRVEPPRASDAIAVSLRDAFARECPLPEDMAALLRRLDDYEFGTAH